MAAGGVVFLPLGGILAEWHWRGPFLVYLLPVFLLPLAVAVIRDAPQRSAHGEVAGERRAPFPLMLSLGLWFVAFLGMVLFYLLPVQLPFLLREFGAADPWIAGVALALNTAISAVASLNFRRVRAFAGPRRILAFAFFAIALGFTIVALANGVVDDGRRPVLLRSRPRPDVPVGLDLADGALAGAGSARAPPAA